MGHLGDLVLNDGTDTSLDVVEHVLLFSTSKTFFFCVTDAATQ
jgi:hypothetical protein